MRGGQGLWRACPAPQPRPTMHRLRQHNKGAPSVRKIFAHRQSASTMGASRDARKLGKVRKLWTLAMLASLCACASSPPVVRMANPQGPTLVGAGVLFGSLLESTHGPTAAVFQDAQLTFADDAGVPHAQGQIVLRDGSMFGLRRATPRDIQEASVAGASFCLVLPPGHYAFVDGQFSHPNIDGPDQMFRPHRGALHVPFEIRAGRATYTGALLIQGRAQAVSTSGALADVRLMAVDARERDAQLAQLRGCLKADMPIDAMSAEAFQDAHFWPAPP